MNKYTVVHCAGNDSFSTEKIEAASPRMALERGRFFGRRMTQAEIKAMKERKK